MNPDALITEVGTKELNALLDAKTFTNGQDLHDQVMRPIVDAWAAAEPKLDELGYLEIVSMASPKFQDALYRTVETAWRKAVGPLAGCQSFDQMARDLASI